MPSVLAPIHGTPYLGGSPPGRLTVTSGGLQALVKDNLTAVVPPTVNDDSGNGYTLFSQWLDTATGYLYVCFSATVGAAVWRRIAASTTATGTGALVFATSPTLVTPILGVATATSVNKVTITAPATGSTLTIQDGFTLTVSGNSTINQSVATSASPAFAGLDVNGSGPSSVGAIDLDQTLGTIANQTTYAQTITVSSHVAANSTNYIVGLDVYNNSHSVASGVTDSGFRYGSRYSAYVDASTSQGTLARLYGLVSEVGIYRIGAGAVISDVRGMHIWVLNADADGTMTSAYGLYIQNDQAVGTITNRWGVYVDTGVLGNNYFSTNVLIGATAAGTSATKTLLVGTGTAPSSSPADAFQMYSADQAAGNACAHFRTEGGTVVKLYQETTGVAEAAFTENAGGTAVNVDSTFAGYTLQQVVKALQLQGLLA